MKDLPIKSLATGILGGIAGGIAGGFICKFLASQGLYGVALPGALVGLGFAFSARKRHIGLGIVSGILGLLAGLLTQWKVYSSEPSFLKLVGELKDYHFVTWIMLGIGTAMAFSIGMGNPNSARNQRFHSDDQT